MKKFGPLAIRIYWLTSFFWLLITTATVTNTYTLKSQGRYVEYVCARVCALLINRSGVNYIPSIIFCGWQSDTTWSVCWTGKQKRNSNETMKTKSKNTNDKKNRKRKGHSIDRAWYTTSREPSDTALGSQLSRICPKSIVSKIKELNSQGFRLLWKCESMITNPCSHLIAGYCSSCCPGRCV